MGLVVFRGTKAKTASGLSKSDLIKNKKGRVVSKKQSAQGKGLRQHQGLDCCCPEGQEGFGHQGLRRSEEGNSSLQEGQGALPVSKLPTYMKIPKLQLRAWGCLRPWSAVALRVMMCGEHR